jgi:hypothetical protein
VSNFKILQLSKLQLSSCSSLEENVTVERLQMCCFPTLYICLRVFEILDAHPYMLEEFHLFSLLPLPLYIEFICIN